MLFRHALAPGGSSESVIEQRDTQSSVLIPVVDPGRGLRIVKNVIGGEIESIGSWHQICLDHGIEE